MMTPSTGILPDAEKAFLAGNFERAERFCRLQLKFNPADRECQILLGIVSAKLGRHEEAINRLTQVIEEAPSYEAEIALSTLYFFLGDLTKALERGETAIQLAPRELSTYNKIGNELVRLRQFDPAIHFFQRALEYDSDHVQSRQNLASALKDAGRMDESLDAWRAVTLLAPDLGVAWLSYGMLQLVSQDLTGALASGLRAVACMERSVEAQMLAGLALSEMGRASEAAPYFQSALKLNPNHAIAQASLGVVLHEQGQFDVGIQWLKKSLEQWDTNGLAYYIQARSKRVDGGDQQMIERIELLLQRNDLSLLDRSYMEYALGKSYEDLKEFGVSIDHYDRANETAYEFWLSEKPWDRDRYQFTIDRTISTFTDPRIAELRRDGLDSDLPVLIVGMIRSGTTLVEQILSSHPLVTGAGELTYWHEEAVKAFNAHDNSVDSAKLTEIANGYLQLLRKVDPKAKRITDKLPHNYAVLGLVQPALPNGRVIHIRRNPVDNCVSVYTTGYARPPGFTLKRENIVFAYREYLRLMEHWRCVLPEDRFLEVDYEDLIENREAVTRKMIAFIGLEWSDRCLQHESNVRTVHTPSAWQVRQPLYKTSIERWRNFEPWIAPFDELLHR